MGVHDGHRQRLRERFLLHNLESFHDVNALELLLSYAIPRRDTNELAHSLLEHFGSLQAVLDASYQELIAFSGIGEQAASLIRLVPQLVKKAAVSQADQIHVCNTTELLRAYLEPRFMNERDEVLYMLCLDSRLAVICCTEIARGVVNGLDVGIRRVVEEALKRRADAVVLAHNHPGGLAIPSVEDDFVTKQLSQALSSVQIRLLDHLIFAGSDFTSYRCSGCLL